MTDFSNEAGAPDSRSEEDVELVYLDSSHPERALQIGVTLSEDDKVWFKNFYLTTLMCTLVLNRYIRS